MVLRDKSPVNLSRKALAGLTARAAAIGCSPAQLATELLETIARDNLYDAVLDKAPLQPADSPGVFGRGRQGTRRKTRLPGNHRLTI